MNQELKIQLTDATRFEQWLVDHDAIFKVAYPTTDTYFRVPEYQVKKISETDDGIYFVSLVREQDQWILLEKKAITNEEKEGLCKKYEVKKVLHKEQRKYIYDGVDLNLNYIEGVGNFLIVDGAKKTKTEISQWINIPQPIFITASFDNI